MWPVDSLRWLLPDSFQAFEDTHFVQLLCTRCDWTAIFSASGVSTDTLIAEARLHRCQDEPEGVRR